MVDGFAKTPHYVLKDGSHPTCPAVLQTTPGDQTTAVFGFSGKPAYDVFWKCSSLALTPYPLIKRYLQDQIALNSSQKLIVLDAVSPQQAVLRAATYPAVLESLQLDSSSVAVSHHLILDEASSEYRVVTVANATPEKLESRSL